MVIADPQRPEISGLSYYWTVMKAFSLTGKNIFVKSDIIYS